MTSRDFCYWLQGFFEISKHRGLDGAQTDCIQKHLSMVFKHEIDPSFSNSAELNDIHQTAKPPKPPLSGNETYRC